MFSLGNYRDALDYYERFHKLCPDEGAASLFMGNCLLNMGKAEEALPHYEDALRMLRQQGASTAEVLQCLAFTYSQLDRVGDALRCIDTTLKQNDVNRNEVLVVRGHILLEHGKVKQAIACFLEALRATSFSHEIFFRIAISVYDCGYPTIAYRMFKAYTDSHHDDSNDGIAYLASCCKYINRHDEYLKYLRLACEKNPGEARKILGDDFPEGMDPKDYYGYELGRETGAQN